VNSSLAKEELYRWLRMPMPDVDKGEAWPVGYCHFPQYSKEYFEQLTAERLVTRFTAGRRVSAWEKVRDRNEALDCRVYARAAAASMRIDTWQEPRWEQLEAALTVPVAATQAPAKPAQLQTNAVTVPKFQSFSARDTSLD
jgi:phage terminase large subunit GpA-like protein